MCPGFDSRTRRYKWVEFVVGSRPCSEGLSPGSPVFLPPQKLTLLNSNSIRNTWPHKLLALNTTVSKQRLFIYLSIYLKYYYSHVHHYLQYGFSTTYGQLIRSQISTCTNFYKANKISEKRNKRISDINTWTYEDVGGCHP